MTTVSHLVSQKVQIRRQFRNSRALTSKNDDNFILREPRGPTFRGLPRPRPLEHGFCSKCEQRSKNPLSDHGPCAATPVNAHHRAPGQENDLLRAGLGENPWSGPCAPCTRAAGAHRSNPSYDSQRYTVLLKVKHSSLQNLYEA